MTSPRPGGLALLALLLAASAAPAQDLFGMGGEGPPPAARLALPAALARGRVTEPARPFRIGRDNLAFANLSGAI